MSQKRIFFVGLGNLGAKVFDEFVRTQGDHRFLVGGRNVEALRVRTNVSLLSALQLGFYPQVSCTYVDVDNIEQTAETIAQFKPDLIFCTVIKQLWPRITTLPQPLYARLYQAQFGPWLPLTLSPIYKLMQAVQQTGLNIKVLNASYPDGIHAVLHQVGLSPTTGIGNIANNIPALRASIALKLNKPLEQVDVRFVAAYSLCHRISRQGDTEKIPFHLTALVNGEDVTHLLDMENVFDLLPSTFNRSVEGGSQLITAASAAVVSNGIIHNTNIITHAPGPNGLPGGYPVRVNAHGVEVVLPPTLSLEAAIQINEAGLRTDGIERIENDGTVYFIEENMEIFKEILHYHCRSMPLAEVHDRAQELQAKYKALVDATCK